MSLKIGTFLSKNRIAVSNLIKRCNSTEQTAQAGQTHFGFQSVPEEEKSEKGI